MKKDNKGTQINLGSIYDIIPIIKDKLGNRCPEDDILNDILSIYTNKLFESINKAMYIHSYNLNGARKYNPDLPTEQEVFDNYRKNNSY